MHTEEYDSAKLISKLYDELKRQKSGEEKGAGVELNRAVSEQHTHSETVSSSTDSTSSWDHSENSTWGLNSW